MKHQHINSLEKIQPSRHCVPQKWGSSSLHPEGNINVCTELHGSPSNWCWDISAWTKPIDRQTLNQNWLILLIVLTPRCLTWFHVICFPHWFWSHKKWKWCSRFGVFSGTARPSSVSEDVRAACRCDAAQMVMFTALQSDYLLQPSGLADPTVTANGAVGKTNSCNEIVSVKWDCWKPLRSKTQEYKKETETDGCWRGLSESTGSLTFQLSLFRCVLALSCTTNKKFISANVECDLPLIDLNAVCSVTHVSSRSSLMEWVGCLTWRMMI